MISTLFIYAGAASMTFAPFNIHSTTQSNNFLQLIKPATSQVKTLTPEKSKNTKPVEISPLGITPTDLKPMQPIKPVALATLQPMAPIVPPKPKSFAFSPMLTYTANNTYDVGQCTYGVESMKGNIPPDWGNAGNWKYAAAAAGYTVSDTPLVGAVGVEENGYYGHVVVVTAVNGDGTVTIEEMNYDATGDGLYRSYVYPVGMFSYIYI